MSIAALLSDFKVRTSASKSQSLRDGALISQADIERC